VFEEILLKNTSFSVAFAAIFENVDLNQSFLTNNGQDLP